MLGRARPRLRRRPHPHTLEYAGILGVTLAAAAESKQSDPNAAATPGPARLYALAAGAFLALLGVLGFFYDAGFGTGVNLAGDDLAGLLIVNGWRNVIYLATGVLGLAFAARTPRRVAFGLGLFYFVFAISGLAETERDIGSLLDAVPLGDTDNGLHLTLGVLGLGAALIDGPLPKLSRPRRARSGRGSRDRRRADPRPGDAA